MPKLPSPTWRVTQGTVLFVAGLAGVIHETLWQEADRPTLLLLFAAMMGLPAFLSGGGGSDKEDRGRGGR